MSLFSLIENLNLHLHFDNIIEKLRNEKDRKALGWLLIMVGVPAFAVFLRTFGNHPLTIFSMGLAFAGSALLGWGRTWERY